MFTNYFMYILIIYAHLYFFINILHKVTFVILQV